MNEATKTGHADNQSDALARIIQRAGPRSAPPAATYDAVRDASFAAWQSTLRRRRIKRRSYAMAASVLIAVCSVLLLQVFIPKNKPVANSRMVSGDVAVFSGDSGNWSPLRESGIEMRSGDRLRTAEGGGVAIALTGGISVRLAEHTELAFMTERRMRLLNGTVYVDSGDTGDSVELLTPMATVRDIGTQFEVKIVDDGMRIRVRSGSIAVDRENREIETAAAAEQLEIEANGNAIRQPFAANDAEWNWVQKLAVLPTDSELTVLAYLTWAAHEMGERLEFDSEASRLSAEFEPWYGDVTGLTPAQLFEVIGTGTDFSILQSDDGRTLVSRDSP